MDYSTTFVRAPRDEAEIRRIQDLFTDRGEFTGPPIVVHTDAGTQKRWVVSDPHRYAAAQRAGITPPTVELAAVFGEAGMDYERQVERARQQRGVVEEEVFVGSREWIDGVLRGLPDEVQRKYWTEVGGLRS